MVYSFQSLSKQTLNGGRRSVDWSSTQTNDVKNELMRQWVLNAPHTQNTRCDANQQLHRGIDGGWIRFGTERMLCMCVCYVCAVRWFLFTHTNIVRIHFRHASNESEFKFGERIWLTALFPTPCSIGAMG